MTKCLATLVKTLNTRLQQCRAPQKTVSLEHMKHCLLYTLLVWLFAGSVFAQAPDSMRLQRTLEVSASFASSDNFSNIYVVTSDNALLKFDSVGRQVAMYTNNRLGTAAMVDASNPLKILVWYPDFQTVVWLDRTLNEMGRLNFSQAELYSVRCVAMAFDGNIWAFDDAISKLVKLNLEGMVLLESQALNVNFPRRFSATRLRDNGQRVYLNDPANGLCTLDQYANLEKVYNTFSIHDFEIVGDWLCYLENGQLCLQRQDRLQTIYVALPAALRGAGANVWLGKRCIYWQQERQLQVYSWQ